MAYTTWCVCVEQCSMLPSATYHTAPQTQTQTHTQKFVPVSNILHCSKHRHTHTHTHRWRSPTVASSRRTKPCNKMKLLLRLNPKTKLHPNPYEAMEDKAAALVFFS
jgi:hypothetical protein